MLMSFSRSYIFFIFFAFIAPLSHRLHKHSYAAGAQHLQEHVTLQLKGVIHMHMMSTYQRVYCSNHTP